MERLTWLGHSTVLLEVGGARILTDPVLRRRVAHLHRDTSVAPVQPPLHAVLISHLHHDHLDLPSLRRLDPSAMLVVPRGAGRLRILRRLGREVREVAAGDTITVAGALVRAVPAAHDGRRLPWTTEVEPLGFVVEGRRTIYFAGDTELFDGMRALAGDLDVALLPVSGWGPRLGRGHMDPRQAARAAGLLRPAVAVPIHWGTFTRIGLRRDVLTPSPGAEFADRVAEHAPQVRVEVLDPGNTLSL
jgi:L-ascorbate metabolism protein UlaG (beta-lactamase superfamily)